MGAHAHFLQLQGEKNEGIINALRSGNLSAARLDDQTRSLLEFVELLTKHSYQTTQDDIEKLRQADWSDEQIAETVYITALFAFFNRVADAFGLESPDLREYENAPPGPEGV